MDTLNPRPVGYLQNVTEELKLELLRNKSHCLVTGWRPSMIYIAFVGVWDIGSFTTWSHFLYYSYVVAYGLPINSFNCPSFQ